MSALDYVYFICFIIGLGYAILTAALTGVFDVTHGGHDGDVSGGHDAGTHTGDSAPADHSMHFSPFSPIMIATFMSAFGGGGIICTKAMGMAGLMSIGPAFRIVAYSMQSSRLVSVYLSRLTNGDIWEYLTSPSNHKRWSEA